VIDCCSNVIVYRCHALSISSQNIPDPDCSDTEDQLPAHLQYRYRNFTDARYSIYVDVVRTSVRSCPQVSSKVEKPLNLPMTVGSVACMAVDGPRCKLKVTLYPQVVARHCILHSFHCSAVLWFVNIMLSILTATFPGEPWLAGFTEAKDNGGGGDNWRYKTCSSQIVTTNKPTPNFLQAGCPSCRPTNTLLKVVVVIISIFSG